MKINKLLILAFLLLAHSVSANVSLSLTDITFSNEDIVEGQSTRIFARVYNYGTEDIFGLVEFEGIGEPQIISIRPNTYDDVFVDWTPSNGSYDISINVTTNDVKDKVVKKDVFVDKDSDNDGIGDSKDNDNDNDGISDDEEVKIGTSTILADSDNDGVDDKDDLFPTDPSEIADNDLDGIGDNSDLDDDNDGLNDNDEIVFYDTDPLSSDTDKDGVLDLVEIENDTNPLSSDTDKDGVNDREDKFPLDPSKSYASVLDTMQEYFAKIEMPPLHVLGLVLLALFILLMILIKRNRI